jgi:sugar lactone lactonase YvrE
MECVLPWNATLAEGPMWSAAESRLYWIDTFEPSLNRFDPETRKNETRLLDRMVTAIVPTRTGTLVGVTPEGVAEVDFATGRVSALVDPEADIPDNRFNDAKCDSRGRLWSGTMRLDASGTSGSLYVVNGDLSWKRMDTGFVVSNGLDWSPDDKTLYFVDSATGRIYAYQYDAETGALGKRSDFVVIRPEHGRPDGLCVDAEGFVWCALWDGWCVRRYAPDGRLDRELRLPVPRPRSVAFGGKGLRTLYVTTARVRLPSRILNEAPNSGGLFAAEVSVPGREPMTFDYAGRVP